MLTELSQRFGEAQVFLSYRVVDARVWLRAQNGAYSRGFLFADGMVYQNFGDTTACELDLGFPDISGRSCDDLNQIAANDPENPWFYGSEDDLLRVAGKWSVDPGAIGRSVGLEPSAGFAGMMRAF